MKMPRLLLFASGQLNSIGGIQRSYQFLVNYLVNRGWSVDIFGFAEGLPTTPSLKELAYDFESSVSVHIIPSSVDNKDLYSYVVDNVSNENYDVGLVVNSSPKALPFLAYLSNFNIPSVYSMRGSPYFCLYYLWRCRVIFDLPFKVADAVHLLLPSYKNIFDPAEHAKIKTIPSQIEPATSFASPDQPNADGRYKVIYSGRLSFEKQLQYLILAFSSLAEEFSNWDLQIIGNGPLEEKLKKQAQACGFADRIEWMSVDNTEAMYELYPKAHLKVLPSEYEGCPMALREAMAHGLPVIAYDTCSGSNEIIEHDIDGLLATANEPIGGLASAMKSLMNDSKRRVDLGKKGIEKAAQYLPEPINKEWESLLLSAIDRKKKVLNNNSELMQAKYLLGELLKEGAYSSAMLFKKNEELYQSYRQEFLTIYGHDLFDERYYLEKYLDVKESGQDPLLHYISKGWRDGYNPSPLFDNEKYRIRYMKQNESDICPLYHFYTVGAFEGSFPIAVDDRYFERWPGRKPKNEYSIIEDLSVRFESR
ncbi:glycosyltransferase family 4 protein [Halomonas sp. ATBC28]|uniref:glycosyltransferase n=1 Tax=Halomonas sp. ATBC28 TaxID=2545264 RepID=UPI00110D45A3|nr:glycosyltransferase [Halomonas sp. ATBC28]TMU23208.1 glycosyltransferase family 4 protein [Halomonas sp. ATBC28]